MAYPTISIVTPSYNQGQYLEQTLDSVFSQNYPNLELVVMDGGSTDNSVDIIRKHESRIKYWRSRKDEGQTAAIMEGFQHTSGEIMAWLNSDDYYEPGTLHLVAETFAQNKDAAMVYGDYIVVHEDGRRILKRKISCDFNVMAYAYLMIPQPSAFWTRSAYEAVGGLDPSLRYVMDYDLFLKLAKHYTSKQIIHLKTPLSSFRVHPKSKSVSCRDSFSEENIQVVSRLTRQHTSSQMKWLRYLYLLKTEWMYLTQRGYLPLSKDASKA